MSDLVARLRELHTDMHLSIGAIASQAADEIERLSELAKLQGQEIGITRERGEALEGVLQQIIHEADNSEIDNEEFRVKAFQAARGVLVPVGGVKE